jgi:uncharacterized membrane protein SpoIIM required for sporulation
MVLESIFPTKSLLENKWLFLGFAILISLLSVFVSVLFFESSASILSIAFITMGFMYFLIKVFYNTEKVVLSKEKSFFRRYLFVVEIYFKIFAVLVIIFTLLFVFLPEDYRNVVFKEQVETLSSIDSLRASINVAGNLYLNSPTGLFGYIFLNNLGVLFAILLFSFIFGVGALFIIVYQASIFGSVVGTKILAILPTYVSKGAYAHIYALVHGSFLSLGLLPHGLFELSAYFLAAVVGGIISAILHGHYIEVRANLKRIILDLGIILSVAIICLLIGALIETNLILG